MLIDQHIFFSQIRLLILGWCVLATAKVSSSAVPQESIGIPKDCERKALEVDAIPGSFTQRGPLLIGLSSTANIFYLDEPVRFHLWMDNPDDVERSYATCSDLDWFKASIIDLYDSSGIRLLRKSEVTSEGAATRRRSNVPGEPFSCTRNILRKIAPHTCQIGDDYDLTVVLNDIYTIAPGSYDVRVLRISALPSSREHDNLERTYEPTDFRLRFTVSAGRHPKPAS